MKISLFDHFLDQLSTQYSLFHPLAQSPAPRAPVSVLRGSCAGGLPDPPLPPHLPHAQAQDPTGPGHCPSALTSKILLLWSPFLFFLVLSVDDFFKKNLSSGTGEGCGDGVKAGACLQTVTFTGSDSVFFVVKFGECMGWGVGDIRILTEEKTARKDAGPTSRERAQWGLGKQNERMSRPAL